MNVEQGSFTPLVFSTHGGYGPECLAFHKQLASALATKTNTEYSKVMATIRCKLSYIIQRAAILCLRGSRPQNTRSQTTISSDFDIAFDELKLS